MKTGNKGLFYNIICNRQFKLSNLQNTYLTKTWFLDQSSIIDNNNIIISSSKICFPHVRAGGQIPPPTEAVDHDLGGIVRIEL